jgi:hypothetical protein
VLNLMKLENRNSKRREESQKKNKECSDFG